MLGAKIKEARKAAGLTQKELGAIVGKSEATVCEWENGKRSPEVDLLPVIATRLNTSIAALLGEDAQPVVLHEVRTLAASDEENLLLQAYRAADPVYRAVALELLQGHPAQKKESRA